MIGYLFAVIFISLIWTVVVVMGLPLAIALIPTGSTLASVAAIYLYKRHRLTSSNLKLEQTLSNQADAQAKSVSPDQQSEVLAMKEEFAQAVSSLKSSKLSRGGINALSVLPWYVIIGPPGAGKSTALRNSGLQFPRLSARGGGVRGLGGTRNCEWWLTNEAVILDTAGRYISEDDDRDEWFAFLDTLSKTRAGKPINGVLVSLSVGDLMSVGEETAAEKGHQIRERLDELMSRLKVIVPVYVVFTKGDLISGFVETFGELHKSDRGQIWGFTTPLDEEPEGVVPLFQERFDGLVDVIEKRALKRIGQERRPELRAKIHQFPSQLAGLRSNLSEFLRSVFLKNVYQDTPRMRGVYFTSGTQEGKPIDLMMNSMAEAFGITPATVELSESSGEPKSYFLRDVFSQVIFKDQNLAVRSTSERERRQLLRYVYAAGALVFGVLLLLFPTLSYIKNRELVQSVNDVIEAAKKVSGSAVDATWLIKIDPLRAKLEELKASRESGAPLAMRFGMYQGEAMYNQGRAVYLDVVGRALLEPAFYDDLNQLDAFARAQEKLGEARIGREQVHHYDELKLHLLFSGPKTSIEPLLSEAQQSWMAAQLVGYWVERNAALDSPEPMKRLESTAKVYTHLLNESPLALYPRNEPVVRRVRSTLSRLPWSTLTLEKMVAELEKEGEDIRLSSILGGSSTALKSTGVVRSAFTKKTWDETMRKKLSDPIADSEGWILSGQSNSESVAAEEIQKLTSAYFQQYIQEWKNFLQSIHIDQPANNGEALALLEDLTQGKPAPLVRLFKAVAQNVKLSGASGGAVEQAKSGVMGYLNSKLPKNQVGQTVVQSLKNPTDGDASELSAPDVEKAFAGWVRFGSAPESPPLDLYQEQLEFLRDALRTLMDNPDDAGPFLARMQTARIRVRSLIDNQEVGWRPRLEAVLLPPLEGTWRSSTRDASGAASQRWCSGVFSPFETNVAKYYPFSAKGKDVSLTDVADFFRPGQGTLWSYYNANLKNDVVLMGQRYEFAKRFGNTARALYNQNLLKFLDRAREITNALFSQGSGEVGTTFSVTIHPSPRIASISFAVDGNEVDYRNGPEMRQTFHWPSPGKKPGSKVTVRNNQGAKDDLEASGEWGLFHLLERADLQYQAGGPAFSATWKMKNLGVEVHMDFEPSRRESPFQKPKPFSMFRDPLSHPPHAIGKSGPGCGQ